MEDKDEKKWVEWAGGAMPIDGSTMIFIRYADQVETIVKTRADFWEWDHNRPFEDRIIAYREAD